MTDRIINCPRCSGNACYETDHTFSNGFNLKSYQCMGCGWTTNNTLIEETQELKNIELQLPELYKDLKFVDSNKQVWFPSVINIFDQGIVFVNGTSINDWEWVAIKSKEIDESEKEKFPIPGTTGKFYQKKPDLTTQTNFGNKGFMDALEFIGFFNK